MTIRTVGTTLAALAAVAAIAIACSEQEILQGEEYRPDGRIPAVPASASDAGIPRDAATDAEPLPSPDAATLPANTCEGARDAGLTEDRVDLITDDYADSALTDRDKTVIRYVDTMLHDPHGMTDDQRAALAEQLDDGQLVELTLGIGLFHGFSKIAVALGPPPDMPTMVVPTPDWPPR